MEPDPDPPNQSGGRRASDKQPPTTEQQAWIPKPPASKSTADFIVSLFAITVATILMLLTVGIIVAAFQGGDVKSYFAVITSIVTSMIAALVGYLAGKNSSQHPGPPEP